MFFFVFPILQVKKKLQVMYGGKKPLANAVTSLDVVVIRVVGPLLTDGRWFCSSSKDKSCHPNAFFMASAV